MKFVVIPTKCVRGVRYVARGFSIETIKNKQTCNGVNRWSDTIPIDQHWCSTPLTYIELLSAVPCTHSWSPQWLHFILHLAHQTPKFWKMIIGNHLYPISALSPWPNVNDTYTFVILKDMTDVAIATYCKIICTRFTSISLSFCAWIRSTVCNCYLNTWIPIDFTGVKWVLIWNICIPLQCILDYYWITSAWYSIDVLKIFVVFFWYVRLYSHD